MNNRRTVLLVEDNEQIMNANVRIFEQADYIVKTAMTLAEARKSLAEQPPDAIVLDIMLPDGNGLDFIPEIRSLTTAPILLLTSMSSKDDRLSGLKAGGDDYITKPYDIDELVARVEAFRRRDEIISQSKPPPAAQADTITRGPLTLNILAGQAFLGEEDLLLSHKEFALLRLLMQSEGQSLSAQWLYEQVWNQPSIGDNRAVQVRISTLRAKLADSGFEIAGIYKKGYCFRKAEKE